MQAEADDAPKGVPFGSSTIDQKATSNQDKIGHLAKDSVRFMVDQNASDNRRYVNGQEEAEPGLERETAGSNGKTYSLFRHAQLVGQ